MRRLRRVPILVGVGVIALLGAGLFIWRQDTVGTYTLTSEANGQWSGTEFRAGGAREFCTVAQAGRLVIVNFVLDNSGGQAVTLTGVGPGFLQGLDQVSVLAIVNPSGRAQSRPLPVVVPAGQRVQINATYKITDFFFAGAANPALGYTEYADGIQINFRVRGASKSEFVHFGLADVPVYVSVNTPSCAHPTATES